MNLEFISNTGFYLENQGVVLGMDLWFTQGAFEGSWFHYPPLRETKYKIQDCKYIYVSHIHPDHCDFNALRKANKDTLFIVPNYFKNLLERKLNSFGFKNVLSMAPGESKEIGDGLKIEMFGQFSNNLFHEAAIGSLIDSSIMIEWGGKTILNCNDNYLTPEWAEKIKSRWSHVDLLLAPHSASGPYPASFRNLSLEEKQDKASYLQTTYIDHFADVVDIVSPTMVVPCAAEYAIVGEQYEKNPYIGLAEPIEAVKTIEKRNREKDKPVKAFHMDCGTILNLETGALEGQTPRILGMEDKVEFAKAHENIPYGYQWEDNFASEDFDDLVQKARLGLWEKQLKLKWFQDYTIYFSVDEEPAYEFTFADSKVTKLNGKIENRKTPSLECFLSKALFYSIMKRKSHWNNAEGGLHIDFYRQPDEYVPEVFTLLSFFHLPEV